MKTNSFYSTLGYDEFLRNNSEIGKLYPDFQEIEQLGADKIYFSGSNPAVLFVEVSLFNDEALRRIAKIQHNAWNYRKILLLFAVSDTEIRIYNCQAKPNYIDQTEKPEKKLSEIQIFSYAENADEHALAILSEVFSRIGIDCGLLWTTDYEVKNKVNIQRRLDKFLVESLIKTANALENDIQEKNIIHGLLMRSLFILFLEDKGAAQEAGLYENIKPGSTSYLEILKDIDATYRLYDEVQTHFNGNVFPVLAGERNVVKPEHLELIRRCFTDGDISGQPKLFINWKLFKFDIIQIELLSEIYENFLGELKREKGQFYTPYSLVELILKDKLPTNSNEFNTKILDPACGSGIFLVESYKRLIKRWEFANPNQKISFSSLVNLLKENIYGIEIDPTAIKVAAFSLYLALVDNLDPKTLWIRTDYQLPYLIFDPDDQSIMPEKQGGNLWRRDTIGEVNADEFVKVDLVVGNPPFGTKDLAESIVNYCKKYSYAKEMVLPFMHKAVSFCPDGKIALVFSSKILTNTEIPFQNFREWLFQKNYVEKIYNLSIFRNVPKNFGGHLFSSTIVPVSIIYFQKCKNTELSQTIEYWAPKTYVKSNLIEGIIVDSSDIKYLPRTECSKPDTKIWKVAMWGGFQDFRLINRINTTFISLQEYLINNKEEWKFGRGIHPEYVDEFICPERILPVQNIDRYYTNKDFLVPNSKKFRPIKVGLFGNPFIVAKETLLNHKLCSSYISEDCYTLYSTYIFATKSVEKLHALNVFINSELIHYYLFLTASEWGIKTPRVLHNELLSIPTIFNDLEFVLRLEKYSKEIINLKECFLLNSEFEISKIENIINEEIIRYFKLSGREKNLISDLINFSYDIYIHGQKSIAFHRTLQPENEAYALILCDELNTFLSYSQTRVGATIYNVGLRDPLNLVVLHFGNIENEIETKEIEHLSNHLKNIDRYMLQKKADSIYVQKQVRYFDNDTVYLIKPNQKRFWTRSQAIDDATSLISEILNMEGSEG